MPASTQERPLADETIPAHQHYALVFHHRKPGNEFPVLGILCRKEQSLHHLGVDSPIYGIVGVFYLHASLNKLEAS